MPTKADLVPAVIGGVTAVVYSMFLAQYIPFGQQVGTFIAGFAAVYVAFHAKNKGWGR